MENQERIVITVPKNLLTKARAADYKTEDLELFDSFEAEYSGYGLLKLRKEYSALESSLSNRISNLKINEMDQYELLSVKKAAVIYNYALVKDALALANTPINNTIYTKDFLENDRASKINLQRELAKNKKSSTLKVHLKQEILAISKHIKKCEAELTEYNNNVKLKLELLELD